MGNWKDRCLEVIKYLYKWVARPISKNLQHPDVGGSLRNGAAVDPCSTLLPLSLAGILNKICEASIKRKKKRVFFSQLILRHYENKTKTCLWRCVNLLQYRRRKPPCFEHLLRPSSGRRFSFDILQRTSKLIYKHKILSTLRRCFYVISPSCS